MEGTVDASVAKLVSLIEKYISTPGDYRPFDLGLKIQYFTLDVISDLAFGKAFGYLENDADVFDYIGISTSIFPFMHTIANVPAIPRFLQSPLMRGVMPKETDPVGFGAFIG